MFEQPTPNRSSFAAPAIGLAASVAGILVSIGLCGIGSGRNGGTQFLTMLGTGIFVISILTLLTCGLWLFVALIASLFRK